MEEVHDKTKTFNVQDVIFNIQDFFLGVTTVGARGQVVIPQQARELLSINPKDKLLVFKVPDRNALILAKTDEITFIIERLQNYTNILKDLVESEKHEKPN